MSKKNKNRNSAGDSGSWRKPFRSVSVPTIDISSFVGAGTSLVPGNEYTFEQRVLPSLPPVMGVARLRYEFSGQAVHLDARVLPNREEDNPQYVRLKVEHQLLPEEAREFDGMHIIKLKDSKLSGAIGQGSHVRAPSGYIPQELVGVSSPFAVKITSAGTKIRYFTTQAKYSGGGKSSKNVLLTLGKEHNLFS